MAISIPIISTFSAKGIRQAKEEFKKLEGVGAKTGYALKQAFLPATAALGGLVAIGKSTVTAASDLNEEIAKAGEIFGDGADEIVKFASSAATAIGQSQRQAIAASSTFALFGRQMGLSGQDLVDFSMDFTTLASDLASFNNTTPEDAITAIGAALRGENEPIRRFGVLLDNATMVTKGLELGLITAKNKALKPYQKALVASQLIMEQTTLAQGDFARTADGVANKQRILAAQVENVKASIGSALLPVIQKVLPYLEKFGAWAEKNEGLVLAVAAAIGVLATGIVAANVAITLSNPFTAIAVGITALITGLVIAYKKFEWFRKGVDTVLGWIRRYFELVANGWIEVINVIIRGYNALPFLDNIELLQRVDFTPDQRASASAANARRFESTGGQNITINVNGGDPAAVVDQLRRYSRQNGGISGVRLS